jgi:hypothetical protein
LTFLEYHHFDPPWHVEKHNRPEGIIPLCPTHHGQAEAFTVEQLRDFKNLAHQKPASGRFEWLRQDLVGAVGGCLYHETPVLVQYHSQPVIWFNRDELGNALLNVRMLSTSNEPRMQILDSDFVVTGDPVNFETPPSGRLLRVRYESGDYLRIEFRSIKSLDAATKRFPHIRSDWLAELIEKWPSTFVLISMQVGGTPFRFGPTMTKLPNFIGKGNVMSRSNVGLSF